MKEAIVRRLLGAAILIATIKYAKWLAMFLGYVAVVLMIVTLLIVMIKGEPIFGTPDVDEQ